MSEAFDLAVAAARAEQPEPYIDEEDPSISASWEVRSLADADWALQRLGELARERAENEEVLAFAVAKLTARHEKLNTRIQRDLDFFTGKLRMFTEANRGALLTGKSRSRALHHGSIGFRKTPDALVVKNKEALLAWCRVQPVESGVLRIKEEPAIAEIKRLIKNKQEVPDGCDVESGVDEFECKPIEATNG